MVFFGSSSKDEDTEKAVAPNVAKDNLNATREFWVALQRQLATADEKDAKAFLLKVDNKLQANLDIIFYKYWNTEQARSKDCERYITVEQSLRLFDDLVRGSEDVAIPALKEYVKFKMVTGAEENEAIKKKKDESCGAAEKAKVEALEASIKEEFAGKIEKATGDAKKSKNATPLEVLVAEAKALGVDVGDAEKTVEEVKEAKAAADKEKIEAKKEDQKEAEQKKVDKRLEDAKKEVEAAAKKAEERKKEVDDDKAKKGEEAKKEAEAEFNTKYKAAIDKALKKMDDEYRKRTFIFRNAACAAYLENTTSGLSEEEGKTISQNDLNKIMNLTDAEKFNAFAKALGFATDAYDAVDAEIEPKKEEEAAKAE